MLHGPLCGAARSHAPCHPAARPALHCSRTVVRHGMERPGHSQQVKQWWREVDMRAAEKRPSRCGMHATWRPLLSPGCSSCSGGACDGSNGCTSVGHPAQLATAWCSLCFARQENLCVEGSCPCLVCGGQAAASWMFADQCAHAEASCCSHRCCDSEAVQLPLVVHRFCVYDQNTEATP